jgi:nicotinamidase-related amidase
VSVSTLDEKTALVVVDLQKGILGLPTAPHRPDEVLARTVVLADAFRARGLPVVLVRVGFGSTQEILDLLGKG